VHLDASSSSSSSSEQSMLGLVQDTQHLLQHEVEGRNQETGVGGSSSSSSGRERRRLLQQQRQGAGRALKSRWVAPDVLMAALYDVAWHCADMLTRCNLVTSTCCCDLTQLCVTVSHQPPCT
jgi:hypothetical protein